MTREEFSRPSSEATPLADVVHRRWLLSKRVDDGRPLLVREDRVVVREDRVVVREDRVVVREDRVVNPSGFGGRAGRSPSRKAERAGGAPALT